MKTKTKREIEKDAKKIREREPPLPPPPPLPPQARALLWYVLCVACSLVRLFDSYSAEKSFFGDNGSFPWPSLLMRAAWHAHVLLFDSYSYMSRVYVAKPAHTSGLARSCPVVRLELVHVPRIRGQAASYERPGRLMSFGSTPTRTCASLHARMAS
jgi:hypothetical protein